MYIDYDTSSVLIKAISIQITSKQLIKVDYFNYIVLLNHIISSLNVSMYSDFHIITGDFVNNTLDILNIYNSNNNLFLNPDINNNFQTIKEILGTWILVDFSYQIS